MKEYYLRNREKVCAYQRSRTVTRLKAGRKWQRNNLEMMMLSRAKHRAKKEQIPFDITLDDVQIPSYCPVLHIPIRRAKGGAPACHSPSLDRIIPTRGYVRGNVRVISQRANRLKSDMTPWEAHLIHNDILFHAV